MLGQVSKSHEPVKAASTEPRKRLRDGALAIYGDFLSACSQMGVRELSEVARMRDVQLGMDNPHQAGGWLDGVGVVHVERDGMTFLEFAGDRVADSYVKPFSMVGNCGKPQPPSVSSSVSVHVGDGKASFGGLQRCGSVWGCPTCAAAIKAEKRSEVERAVRLHEAAGGGFLFATFTLRHHRGERLEHLAGVLSASMSRFQGGRRWQRIRAELGIIGYVQVTEITYGVNGWHPHRHVVYFTDGRRTDAEVACWIDELKARWVRCCKANTPDEASGFDMSVAESGEAVGRYVSKALAQELTGLESKEYTDHVTPFQLLTKDTPEYRRLWDEYRKATRGKSMFRWSPGMKAAFGIVERTDKEIVESADGEEVVQIERSLYVSEVMRSPRLQAAVLERCRSGRFDSLAALVPDSVVRRVAVKVHGTDEVRRVLSWCFDWDALIE